MAQANSLSDGRRVRLVIAGLILIVLAGSALFAAGRLSGGAVTGTPQTTSAEAGFARDMQTHHQQAVQLAMIVRDLTGDPEVRLLAYDIALSQSQQSGQLYGWLAAWNLPQAPNEPSMTWMSRPPITGAASHDDMENMDDGGSHVAGEPMPGLATAAQVQTLMSLTGLEAERYFLELMIAHHEGGVQMAEAVLERSTDRVVVDLASSVVAAQRSEIELMTKLLSTRSGS